MKAKPITKKPTSITSSSKADVVEYEYEPEFLHVDQVDFFNHVLCTNCSDLVTLWNKGVSRWLRNYVYLRVVPHVKKGEKRRKLLFGMLTTMFVSALWHGPYPGYFVFWSFLAFAQTSDKYWESKVQKRVLNDDWIWNSVFPGKFLYFLGFLYTKVIISYCSAAFHILTFHEVIDFYRRMHWFGHIAMAII